MMKVKEWFLLWFLLSLLTGCGDKRPDDGTRRGPHGELELVSLSPEETFYSIQKAILDNDATEVYKFYSWNLRMLQNETGLREQLQEHAWWFRGRYQEAKIIQDSMQYFANGERAVCRVQWGTGEVSAYTFIYEEDGWKLGREMLAVDKK